MRIKNKYLRNKHFKEKHYKTIRNREHPFETYCPSPNHPVKSFNRDLEKQIKENFKWINLKARALESGARNLFNAPKRFRKQVADSGKRQEEKNFLQKLIMGDFDALPPFYKKDANWLYF